MIIRRFDAPLGAEVTEIDLRQPMDPSTFEQIAGAFYENSILVIRDQKLTEEQHIAFSRRFGELEVLGFYKQYLKPHHPEIFVVSNIIENGQPIGLQEAGRIWHTDVSYKKEPSMGSLLYAIEVPEKNGVALGDTLFASTATAYDALSDDMKNHVQKLRAVHRLDEARYRQDPKTNRERGARAELTYEQRQMIQDVVHPVVRTHPVTGRRCLYVNELYTFSIVGLLAEEGARLIEELCDHITRPEFIYRHKWRVGDLLIWDNCSTQHQAVGDYALPQRRLMQRTTIRGTVPF